MRAVVYQGPRNVSEIGVVGVYPPKDPKDPDALMKKGTIVFDFGEFFDKGLTILHPSS